MAHELPHPGCALPSDLAPHPLPTVRDPGEVKLIDFFCTIASMSLQVHPRPAGYHPPPLFGGDTPLFPPPVSFCPAPPPARPLRSLCALCAV